LRKAGATAVFNIYTEAGTGFADHIEAQRLSSAPESNMSILIE